MLRTSEIISYAKKAVRAGLYHIGPIWKIASTGVVSDARFRANKWTYGTGDTTSADQLGIHQFEGSDSKFFISPTEKAGVRGGNLPWEYTQGLCDNQKSHADKVEHILVQLARLPTNASLTFNTHPELRDVPAIREAFRIAGWAERKGETLIYKGKYGEDPLPSLSANARSNIKKGRRDLEACSMSVDEFFDFYETNLGGQPSHFHLGIDRQLTKTAVAAEEPSAQIIAVRRKSENGEINPVEAAILVGIGSDRHSLMRISYREGVHPQAVKMLVVEAMQMANNRQGHVLDTQGYTQGGAEMYNRFNVFEKEKAWTFKRTAASRIPHYWKDRPYM